MKTNSHITEKFSVKRIIIAALSFMMLGTLLELYLLNHFEDWLQFIPFVCIFASAIMMIVLMLKQSEIIQKLFVFLMIATAMCGMYGIYLHLSVNFQFEQEMTPSHSNWDLFVESLSGAIPTLAPGSLIVLALIGYSYIKLIKQNQ